MNNYADKEIKVLDVDVKNLCAKLENLGATKVFDGARVRTSYDNSEQTLISNEIEIRITEEGETKLSLDENNGGERTSIKLRISRAKEMEDLLAKLDIKPVSKVESYRISYELEDVDFDIDKFPEIPAFLEVDLKDSNKDKQKLLKKLSLENNEIFEGSTIKLYERYGKDYIKLFAVNRR